MSQHTWRSAYLFHPSSRAISSTILSARLAWVSLDVFIRQLAHLAHDGGFYNSAGTKLCCLAVRLAMEVLVCANCIDLPHVTVVHENGGISKD